MSSVFNRSVLSWVLAASILAPSLPVALASEANSAEVQSEGNFQQSQEARVLGKKMGASLYSGLSSDASPAPSGSPAPLASPGVPSQAAQTLATLAILGKTLQAFAAHVAPSQSIDEPAYTEFYSFGKRVFSESFYFHHTGITQASVGLSPAEVRVPFVIYPVGPLTLQIDGGVRFQAALQANLLPSIIFPIQMSNLQVKLQASGIGTGFIEGYAKLLVIRGGVGGDVDVIDAQAEMKNTFYFDGKTKPKVQVSALAQFLKGKFYAFADYLNVLKFRWRRFWEKDLFSWKGYCIATGSLSCPK